LLVVLFVTALCFAVAQPCEAVRNVDNLWNEIWLFGQGWNLTSSTVVTNNSNYDMMTGLWSFQIVFCKSVYIYWGNSTADSTKVFGWMYGNYAVIDDIDIDVNPAPQPNWNPKEIAFLQFSSSYLYGDEGAPCHMLANMGRSSTVNIYCGGGEANCTQVPGNSGAACIDSKSVSPLPGHKYCICSILWNDTLGICGGLTFNLLSNHCPNSTAVRVPTPIGPPGPPGESPAAIAGIFFLVVAVLIVVSCIGGYAYNYSVHSKRGLDAVPFYDTCKGEPNSPSYAPVTTTDSRPGYGSL